LIETLKDKTSPYEWLEKSLFLKFKDQDLDEELLLYILDG